MIGEHCGQPLVTVSNTRMKITRRCQVCQRTFSQRKRQAGPTYVQQLEFFTAILLAVSEHRAKSLEVMEDFIADLKKASEQ